MNDNLKNVTTTDWLSKGLTEYEIEHIKELALISAKIQFKRLELEMSQKEFAKMMGVSQGMVSKWESGEYNFTITTLKQICNKLGLELVIDIKNQELVATFV